MNVRLADGNLKSYPLNRQVFSSLKPIKGIAIILDKDTEVEVSKEGRP
ncbi:MAG: hypothetical protein KME01_07525 [Chroococcus sp. CMT-3BRIN-NPC107]|nr:hypothetical protein [Chroococcus sp. CMT-3BRIN-NPC107]